LINRSVMHFFYFSFDTMPAKIKLDFHGFHQILSQKNINAQIRLQPIIVEHCCKTEKS